MIRRPAVTLMEVLIAMFIMAIGMLALLALFPVGAVSMAQALKDDRCAYASTMSENVAIATNVRYGDSLVNGTDTAFPGTGFISATLPTPGLNSTSVTGLLYVDPYAVAQGYPVPLGTPAPLGTLLTTTIQRTSMSLSYLSPGRTIPLTYAEADRFFSIPDDIGFNQSGYPDTTTTGGFVDRGRRYTYAFMLRRQPPLAPIVGAIQSPMYAVQLFAVVYSGRPIASLATTQTEWPFVATILPPNGLQLIAPAGTTAKRGGWILDTTFGNFYRITNIVDSGGVTTLETQQNLQFVPGSTTMNIVIMDYVAEVFDKGFGWQQ